MTDLGVLPTPTSSSPAPTRPPDGAADADPHDLFATIASLVAGTADLPPLPPTDAAASEAGGETPTDAALAGATDATAGPLLDPGVVAALATLAAASAATTGPTSTATTSAAGAAIAVEAATTGVPAARTATGAPPTPLTTQELIALDRAVSHAGASAGPGAGSLATDLDGATAPGGAIEVAAAANTPAPPPPSPADVAATTSAGPADPAAPTSGSGPASGADVDAEVAPLAARSDDGGPATLAPPHAAAAPTAKVTPSLATTPAEGHAPSLERTDQIANLDRLSEAVRTLRRSSAPRTMSISLRPAELGQVQVDLALHDGALQVRLTADTAGGADSLRAATTVLRRDLEAEGLRLGDVTVDVGGGRAGTDRDGPRPHDDPADLGPQTVAVPPHPPARPAEPPVRTRPSIRPAAIDLAL